MVSFFVIMSDKPGRTPTILNISLTTKDTEYQQLFPNGIKRFSMQCTSDISVRFSFESGKVAGSIDPFMTMKAGVSYYEDDVSLNGKIIYLSSSMPGVRVEILIWK